MTRASLAGLDPAVRDAFARGIAEFNAWRFYDCHETLEDIWREAGGKSVPAGLAPFYQGLIKAAAGYHHLLRDNYKGATMLLTDSLRLLSPYRPSTLGVDVDALLDGLRRSLERIEVLGPDHLRDFEREYIPSIRSEPEGGNQDC